MPRRLGRERAFTGMVDLNIFARFYTLETDPLTQIDSIYESIVDAEKAELANSQRPMVQTGKVPLLTSRGAAWEPALEYDKTCGGETAHATGCTGLSCPQFGRLIHPLVLSEGVVDSITI